MTKSLLRTPCANCEHEQMSHLGRTKCIGNAGQCDCLVFVPSVDKPPSPTEAVDYEEIATLVSSECGIPKRILRGEVRAEKKAAPSSTEAVDLTPGNTECPRCRHAWAHHSKDGCTWMKGVDHHQCDCNESILSALPHLGVNQPSFVSSNRSRTD